MSLAEVVKWALKENKDVLPLINIMKQSSNVIELNEDIAVLAGKLNFERKKANKKWGMLDSFILASGAIYGLNILTKDNDFRDIAGAELL